MSYTLFELHFLFFVFRWRLLHFGKDNDGSEHQNMSERQLQIAFKVNEQIHNALNHAKSRK